MQNSKISSIANASKNLRWDAVKLSNSTTIGGVSVGSSMTNAAGVCFPGSKMLGRGENPNTGEGIVHLIHKTHSISRVRLTGNGAGGAAAYIQMRRRNPGVGAVNSYMGELNVAAGTAIAGSTNVIDELIWESAAIQNLSYNASGLTTDTGAGPPIMRECNLDPPLVAVEPYFGKQGGIVWATGADTIVIDTMLYILVESIRMSGEKFRRLLDAYTQMSGNPRGTQA